MSLTADRVVVLLEAKVDAYNRDVTAAERNFTRSMGVVEGRANRMERSVRGSLGGVAGVLGTIFTAAATQAAVGAADAFTRIENSLKVAGLQGEELTAVFDHLFAAAQKNAAPVESLVELYSRAALVQDELGVSTQELLGFTEGVAAALRVSGKSAAESSGALLQLAQALGGGTVRAEEFNSILEGALPIAQAAARGLKEAGGSVARLRQLVIDGKISSEAFFRAFQAGQGTLQDLADTTDITVDGAMTRLYNSFILLAGSVDDSTGASNALIGAMDGLAAAFERLPGLVDAFRSKLDELNSSNSFLDFLVVTQDEAEAFKQQILEMQEAAEATAASDALPSIKAQIAAVEAEIETLRSDTTGLISPVAIDHAVNELARLKAALADLRSERIDVTGGRGGGGGAGRSEPITQVSVEDYQVFTPPKTGRSSSKPPKTPAQNFEEDLAAIRERTEALRLEAQMVGRSTFELERARTVQDLLNEAKRARVAITPELTAQINQEADALANATVALETMEDRQQKLAETSQFFSDTAFDAFRSLIPVIETGNEALDRMIASLIEAAAQALFLRQGPLAGLGQLFASGAPVATGAPMNLLSSTAAAPSFSVPSMPSMQTASFRGGSPAKTEMHFHNAPPVAEQRETSTGQGTRTDIFFEQMSAGIASNPRARRQLGLPMNIKRRG